jgi:hypothetical protein
VHRTSSSRRRLPRGAILDRIRASDSGAIVFSIEPLEAAYVSPFAGPRAASNLAFLVAVVSVVAEAGGLFNILSYAAGRRRRESAFGSRLGRNRARSVGSCCATASASPSPALRLRPLVWDCRTRR